MTLPTFELVSSVSLWKSLPKPRISKETLSMEDVDQAYGYILYRTKLTTSGDGELAIEELHDYARVYLDGTLAGTLDRRLGQNKLTLHGVHAGQQLDILVENSGRVNFTKTIRGERAGITKQVLFAGSPVLIWEIYPLPLTDTNNFHYGNQPCQGPCFYRASFSVSRVADTFLDTRKLTKGFIWVNGKPLGRAWNVGPQNTLYLPAPWLRQGRNEVVVFDLDGKNGLTLEGLDHPILDGPVTK
jgi:beta-galactosidase